MGAQSTDPTAPNYDPEAESHESPLHEVTLAPYFLSKFEMTQGQWMRLAAQNPSQFSKASYIALLNSAGRGWSALHPVEQVSWLQCVKTLDRLGLMLPTEAQWENGARAWTTTVRWSGDDAETLPAVGNVADAYAKSHGGGAWPVDHATWDDGESAHAEVGSYRANAFGLHDVYGNVSEWCLDGYDEGFYDRRIGRDPVASTEGAHFRVCRGASYSSAASDARSAHRERAAPEWRFGSLGLRPARSVTTR
jgi:formylglycine-generating enzyme required for sulfatase activity